MARDFKFSIIVPVYNTESYLEKCIYSLENQDIDEYEIIIINDASTDGSRKIIEHMLAKYNNIVFLDNAKNMGLSDTRNRGMEAARGDYLLFVDSDDYLEKNILGSIVDEIEKNNYPDVLYYAYINEDMKTGISSRSNEYMSKKNSLYSSKQFLINELKHRKLYAQANCGIYKREFILNSKLRFGSGLLHEDELWTPCVLRFADSIFVSSFPLFHYVRRENSITTAKDRTKNGLDLLMIAKMLDKIYDNSDAIIKKLMRNHSAMLYMKGVQIGKLYRRQYRSQVDRKYPLKNACFLYDRLKATLFRLSLGLYCRLNILMDKK